MKRREKKFGTPQEVEEIYSLSKGWLANMRWKRTGPKFFRAGRRRVLYNLADVEEWIRGNISEK